jgi:spore germination protein YaaH
MSLINKPNKNSDNTLAKSDPSTKSTQTPSTNTILCAWIYPGAPAWSATNKNHLNPKDMYHTYHIDILRAQYFSIKDDGSISLISEDPENMMETANGFSTENVSDLKAYSSQQYATVSGTMPGIQHLWNYSANVNAAITILTSFVISNGITGIDIDFENFGKWSSTDYINYKQFITNLGNTLHSHGKKLIICGPVWTSVDSPFPNWNYSDFVSLPVDYMSPMTYDYQWDFGGGAPIAPLDWLATWAKNMLAIFPAVKLIMGLPSYGYTATEHQYDIKIKTYNQIIGASAGAVRDPSSAEMMKTSGTAIKVYNDNVSLNAKRAVLEKAGIKIVSVWHLGGNLWFYYNLVAEPTARSMTY